MSKLISINILNKIGARVIELINEQVAKGIDYEGNTYSYSTKPFSRPARGQYLSKFKRAEKENKVKYFKTKKGSLWMVVLGGYKSYRNIIGRSDNSDYLQDTGKMLAALTYKVKGDKIQIGFTSKKEAEKAFWLNTAGAGKSKTKWKFLGLTDENIDKVIKEFAELILLDIIKNTKFEV